MVCKYCGLSHGGHRASTAKADQCQACGVKSGLHYGDTQRGFKTYNADGTIHDTTCRLNPTTEIVEVTVNAASVTDESTKQAIKALEANHLANARAITELSSTSQRIDTAVTLQAKAQEDQAVDLSKLFDSVAEIDQRLARVAAAEPVIVHIDKMPGSPINVGRQHYRYAGLLIRVGGNLNVAMVGPAGSGKTTAAYWVAQALGLDFYPQSVGPQTSKTDLLGYMSATGDYIPSVAYLAYKHGGLWLIDEMDAANPAVLTIVNALVANRVAGFPNGETVERHADFRVVAAMNTYGRGADGLYVGRAVLDAATLDRFIRYFWDYDWELTAEIAGDIEWTRYCEKLFGIASDLRLKVVIGPRAAINGAIMKRLGIDRADIELETIWSTMDVDARNKLQARANEAA